MGKKRQRGNGEFAVAPAGVHAGVHAGAPLLAASHRQAGHCAAWQAAGGTNTLRQAYSGGKSGQGRSKSERKASDLWFRKCGHGEALWAAYYRGQPEGVVPTAEWEAFTAALASPLPVTFRTHAAGSGADPEAEREAIAAFEARLDASRQAERVGWHGGGGAETWWQAVAGVGKRELKGEAASLSDLLAEGTRRGMLNRQELVSMLPVAALRVPAGAACLDMCASPGSKTMQLLEAVSLTRREATPLFRAGMVVANDPHPGRLSALRDALARHGRPAAQLSRLLVTCHRGENFPSPVRPFRDLPPAETGGGNGATGATGGNGAHGETGKTGEPGGNCGAGADSTGIGFDRVLADVPCSGDGTIRKDPSVLPRWSPALGHQLHATQLEIAWRGLQLLAVGGRMVYSTCSLNPSEDEAVVAALLVRAGTTQSHYTNLLLQ